MGKCWGDAELRTSLDKQAANLGALLSWFDYSTGNCFYASWLVVLCTSQQQWITQPRLPGHPIIDADVNAFHNLDKASRRAQGVGLHGNPQHFMGP